MRSAAAGPTFTDVMRSSSRRARTLSRSSARSGPRSAAHDRAVEPHVAPQAPRHALLPHARRATSSGGPPRDGSPSARQRSIASSSACEVAASPSASSLASRGRAPSGSGSEGSVSPGASGVGVVVAAAPPPRAGRSSSRASSATTTNGATSSAAANGRSGAASRDEASARRERRICPAEPDKLDVQRSGGSAAWPDPPLGAPPFEPPRPRCPPFDAAAGAAVRARRAARPRGRCAAPAARRRRALRTRAVRPLRARPGAGRRAVAVAVDPHEPAISAAMTSITIASTTR